MESMIKAALEVFVVMIVFGEDSSESASLIEPSILLTTYLDWHLALPRQHRVEAPVFAALTVAMHMLVNNSK